MKKYFKNFKISLKLKIAFLFVLLVITMMATVTYIYTIREVKLRVDQVKLRMELLAKNIATIRSVETEDWEVYQSYIDLQIEVNPDIVYIAIFDESNELKAHSLNTQWIEVDSEQMSRMEQINIVLRLDQRQLADDSQQDLESKSVNIIIGEQNLGIVKVGFSLIDLNDEMKKNLNRNFQLALLFTLLAIIVSYFISMKVVKPLNSLNQAMVKISEGDLQQELHIDSRDEIGDMAETFNFMTQGLWEKQLIEKFGRELGFTLSVEKISELITKRLTEALNGDKGFLLLREKNELSNFQFAYSYPEFKKSGVTVPRNPRMCKFFLSTRQPLSRDKFTQHTVFINNIEKVTSLEQNSLITPIIINEEVIGIFILKRNDRESVFSENEKQFLKTLINQAGMAIENAMLLNELTEQERLKRELEIARMVQSSLLPQTEPPANSLDIDGICIPATEIGGDYFDYFPLDENNLGVVIADVTGKGASAAFYMAVVKGIMLSLTPIFKSPKELLIELNKRLYSTMDRKIFVTMIYGIFNLKNKTLKFARAGHNGLIIKNKHKSVIKNHVPPGIGLGLEQGNIFDKTIAEKEINFHQGDAFIFYTDGITEAMNSDRVEFSEEKLIQIISESNGTSSKQIREKIINEINSFVKEAPQHDDITMVTISAT
ncbi:hypothetical protein B6I21_05900 [candidate division KSB1 bacterium 4572_119]|nr:MAG: hypothetical protein B6I21_05900 [candidate division KSB1 bacterium 4572_119]